MEIKSGTAIENVIFKALEVSVNEIATRLIEAGKKDLEREIKEKVAQVAIAMARSTSIQYMRDEIIIRVKFE